MVSRDQPISPVQTLHFGLADWVSTPAPRQLSTNTQLTTLLTHVLTPSTVGTRLRRKNPTHLESNPRLFHPKGNCGTPTPPGRGKCTTGMGAPDPRFPAPKLTPTKTTNRHEQADVLLTIQARGMKPTSRHQSRRTQNPKVSASGMPNVSE